MTRRRVDAAQNIAHMLFVAPWLVCVKRSHNCERERDTHTQNFVLWLHYFCHLSQLSLPPSQQRLSLFLSTQRQPGEQVSCAFITSPFLSKIQSPTLWCVSVCHTQTHTGTHTCTDKPNTTQADRHAGKYVLMAKLQVL